MKKLAITICCVLGFTSAHAQSLNVNIGEICYVHDAANTGDMTFSNGTTLTIEGKTYSIFCK